MKIDARTQEPFNWGWTVFDRDTGKDLTHEFIIAADDSTGQIIKYDSKDGKILHTWPLISEVRNIELVCLEWPK